MTAELPGELVDEGVWVSVDRNSVCVDTPYISFEDWDKVVAYVAKLRAERATSEH